MATRTTFTSASPGALTGDVLLDNLAAHIKKLYDAASLPLTAVGGTANAVTATLDPVLDGSGLVDGMTFTLTWAAANTGGMTLAINGGAAVPVLDKNAAALISGSVVSGLRSLIEYVGGNFIVLTEIVQVTGSTVAYQKFTASGTWSKPAGFDANRMVVVEAWGGGGGGYSGGLTGAGAGGGGGYVRREIRLGDIPASVAVTVGAGGGPLAAGGNTTFGSLLTALGGGAGTISAGGKGGGIGGGASQTSSNTAGNDAGNIYGGGGGSTGGATGGAAEFGGGGGGGGSSTFGGNGGANAVGAIPGGGGDNGATGFAGARGELRVWIS